MDERTDCRRRIRLEAEPSESADLLFTAYAIDVEQSWGPYFLESTRSVVNDGVPNWINRSAGHSVWSAGVQCQGSHG